MNVGNEESSYSNILTNKLSFEGDSRNQYGFRDFFRSATTADNKGVQLSFNGVGHDILDGTSGTLEYRASDKAFRWTAPGDTEGAWVVTTSVQWMTLQSGTPNKELRVANQTWDNLPTANKTITVSITTVSAVKYVGQNTPASIQAIGRLRSNQDYNIVGIGGLKTWGLVQMLPWLNANYGEKGGVSVIRIGTNDISDGTISAATIIANATTVFNSRLAQGRKLIICGEPARWGINTSTPLTAQQFLDLKAVNRAYRDFCNANPENCIFLDFYGISVDPNYSDGRPYANYLRDVVHDGIQGGLDFGNAIFEALKYFGLHGDKIYPIHADDTNVFQVGNFTGSGGSTGTAASGSVRNGCNLARSYPTTGGDATVVGSLLTRLSPFKALGQTLTITGITSGNIIRFRTLGQTLTTLGYVAGDTLYFIVDIEVVSAVNITSITATMALNDSVATSSQIEVVPLANEILRLKSCNLTIPAGMIGTNTIWFNFDVTVGASSSAVVNISDLVVRKVV